MTWGEGGSRPYNLSTKNVSYFGRLPLLSGGDEVYGKAEAGHSELGEDQRDQQAVERRLQLIVDC